MQVPVLDVLTAIRLIRSAEVEYDLNLAPLISLTADVSTHRIGSHKSAGINGVFASPFQLNQLVSVITEVIEPVMSRRRKPTPLEGLQSPTFFVGSSSTPPPR